MAVEWQRSNSYESALSEDCALATEKLCPAVTRVCRVSKPRSNAVRISPEQDVWKACTRELLLDFVDLTYKVKLARNEYKQILHGVSGQFQTGEFIGILGPSGAGKTTLVNILAGYKSNNAGGSIFINGKPRDSDEFRKLSCFIMQDDILLPYLTVLESMMVSASLHLKKDLRQKQKRAIVNSILNQLGLLELCNTRCNDISGGQRKRLAIALELVNNPPIIFLDEPTSGLDSVSAFQCMNVLKTLASNGRIVVCTIHQPSAKLFEKFDKLYLLAEGNCLYQGTVDGLLPYMKERGFHCPNYHNPADYVIEVSSGEYGDVVPMLVKAWNAYVTKHMSRANSASNSTSSNFKQMMVSILPCTIKTEKQSIFGGVSQLSQFMVLFKRALQSLIRDRLFTHLRVVSITAVGFLIGLLYLGIGNDGNKVFNNTGCLFFSLLFLMFTSLMPTVLTFPSEKLVFMREHLNNWYSLQSYYLAKTMADLPFQIAFPVIYCPIVYFMTEQPYEGMRYWQFLTITILTCLVAQSIGLLIGAVAPSLSTAVFVAPITGIPVLLFSGFFVNFETIPNYMQWLTYVSYARYSWEGIIVVIYGNNRAPLECDTGRCIFRNCSDVLSTMDVREDALELKGAKIYLNCVVLAGFFLVLRLVTYLVLRFRLWSHR